MGVLEEEEADEVGVEHGAQQLRGGVQGGRGGDEKAEQAAGDFGEFPHKAAQFAHAAWPRRARKSAPKKPENELTIPDLGLTLS